MELFDELIECEVGIVIPYFQQLIEFCLEVGRFSKMTMSDTVCCRQVSMTS